MGKIDPPEIRVLSQYDYSKMFNGLSTIADDFVNRYYVITTENDGLMHRKQQKRYTINEYIENIKATPLIPTALKNFCYSLMDNTESLIDGDTVFDCIKYIYNTHIGDAAQGMISVHNKFLRKLCYYVIEQTEEEKKENKALRHALAFHGDSTLSPVNDVELSLAQLRILEKYNDYCDKVKAKREAKSEMNKWFKIGDVIAIRGKIRDGSRRNVKKFVVKKIIWSINAKPVNVYILKQISGECNNMTLTKNDCKKYHVKYEENLQVYSMMLNWYLIEKMKK